jgi:hypothetical protein
VDGCQLRRSVQSLDTGRTGRVEAATQPGSVPSTQFRQLPDTSGTPIDHQLDVLVQALATHVQQFGAWPDELRKSKIHRSRQLCTTCCCTNELELARFLATKRKASQAAAVPHSTAPSSVRTARYGHQATTLSHRRKSKTGCDSCELVRAPRAHSDEGGTGRPGQPSH